jgi:hypothetical protein
MSLFRRAATLLSAAALAGAALVGTAGTASAQDLVPSSPYCVTFDGSGVCLALTATFTHRPSAGAGDYTVALLVETGFYCPNSMLATCNLLAFQGSVPVGRTGVVPGNPSLGTVHVTTLRVPEVCVPGACAGPYYVDVDAPAVVGPVASIWVAGLEIPV